MGHKSNETIGVGTVVRGCGGPRMHQLHFHDVPGIVIEVHDYSWRVHFMNGNTEVVSHHHIARSRIEEWEIEDWAVWRMKN